MGSRMEEVNKDFRRNIGRDRIKEKMNEKEGSSLPFPVPEAKLSSAVEKRFDSIENRLINLNRKLDQLIHITRGY